MKTNKAGQSDFQPLFFYRCNDLIGFKSFLFSILVELLDVKCSLNSELRDLLIH